MRGDDGEMAALLLFTDGSVNTKSHVGYGAYLALADHGLPLAALSARVKVRRFAQTSSTRLELQTLLWAVSAIPAATGRLTVYTDSQNIMGLPGRRQRLLENDYFAKNQKRLNNYELYQEFYRMIDQFDCEFVKVRGHQPAPQKDELARIFALVDRAARKALRGDEGGA